MPGNSEVEAIVDPRKPVINYYSRFGYMSSLIRKFGGCMHGHTDSALSSPTNDTDSRG